METNTSLERAGRKAIIGRALLAALGLALLAAYIIHIRKDMTDFEVIWQAGRRLLHGEALYRVSDGHLQFKYSPLAAMACVPFSILPLEAAKACWFVIQVLCLAGIGRLGIALLPARRKSAVFLLGFSFLILGKFLARELVLGQVNLLILLLFLAALASLLKGREVEAGLFWTFSLFFKPYGLIFVPHVLLKKRWRFLAAGAAAAVAGIFLPTAVYGLRGNLQILDEWRKTLSLSTSGLLDVGDNASLYHLFLNLTGGREFSALIMMASAVLILAAAVLWMMAKGRANAPDRPEVLEWAVLAALVPLLSPLSWYYLYLFVFPGLLFLLDRLRGFSPLTRGLLIADFVMIGATLVETMGRPAFEFYTKNSVLAGNALILVFFLFMLRRRAPA